MPRDFGRHWTPVHLDFIVSNLDEMVARLCGLGATLDRKIQIREHGRMANMADPVGNGLNLIEFSGPEYDNLLSAAAGEPYPPKIGQQGQP
jgi:predicted enzyme related to lactoylglutathione lyase